MDVKTRQLIERQIATKLCELALEAGYAISVYNGGDDFELKNCTDLETILSTMFATDEERLYFSKGRQNVCQGVAYFVYGNDGWDVITDYSEFLEPLMAQVNILACKLEEKYA